MPKRQPAYTKTSSAPSLAYAKDDAACRLMARFERAKDLRTPWESNFQEAYDYVMPMKESVFEKTPGTRRTDRIFDETGVVALAECASRIQAGLVPPFARWAGLQAGAAAPPEEKA